MAVSLFDCTQSDVYELVLKRLEKQKAIIEQLSSSEMNSNAKQVLDVCRNSIYSCLQKVNVKTESLSTSESFKSNYNRFLSSSPSPSVKEEEKSDNVATPRYKW